MVLFVVAMTEFVIIIALMCVYKLDFFHKITLRRVEQEISRQEAKQIKKMAELGITAELQKEFDKEDKLAAEQQL